ncbi:hypothetical protein A3A39_04100 [Candidatus Kaiserbacteria bacterium RIFCSPLOWO2_01_FULL_54_13]|uniref:N-acetyltransferase domain-containing protein n=1 Tax=Candidatus Kaiserbacteria bacterium RIFCSPLOWO2_01_FULL_54_13 TaxID=1798512 RepID=A0A1F6F439_9BACT|nr:MAG: hypothetical protein A3A39_04100 [Candidatus Kaiserbacteria bacterium RIFCSPLOWO2_01_FULL_54_13]
MGYWQSTIPAAATIAPATQFDIRVAGWRDFGALATLQKKIVREAEHLAATGKDRKEPLLYALAKAILHRKRVHTIVAEEEGKFVGYITIVFGKFQRVRETAYIVVGVLASHRGRGIGTQLLSRAEDHARDRGMHRVELEVFETNDSAVRLYEKLGYVIEGRRREAVRTDEGYTDIIWMGKLL